MGPYAGMLKKLLEQNPALVRELMGISGSASPLRPGGMLPLQALTGMGNTKVAAPASPEAVFFRQQAEQAAENKRKQYITDEAGRAAAVKG